MKACKMEEKTKNIFKMVENLKEILKEDSVQKQPLFLKIKDSFIYNVVKEATVTKDKPFLIGITGESASGKTTFVRHAIRKYPSSLDGGIYTTVNCDDYFYDTSKELIDAGSYEALFASGFSFDTPNVVNLKLMKEHLIALKNGQDVQSPAYDFVTCVSNPEGEKKKSARIILNEGLYVLNDDLKDIMDIKVYIFTPFDVIKDRWFKRAVTRGKTGMAAQMQFEDVNATAQKYIRPNLECCDVVLNGVVTEDYIEEVINKIFAAIKNI